MVIWLIGLSGAGKTTIGREVFRAIHARDPATVFLDGDDFRRIMGEDLGHTLDDRERNGWRMCRMSQWLENQGLNVIACVLSNFPDQQQWNRDNLKDYFEVFVDASLATLEKRDQKGLYSGARTGQVKNVIGIDLEFHPPRHPDVVLHDEELQLPAQSLAQQIVAALSHRDVLRGT